MYDLLFEKQDSLGVKSFTSFASESGVADLLSFERCVSEDEVHTRIAEDIEAGETAGVNGTPTIVVNGLRLDEPPDGGELARLVEVELERLLTR